MNEYSTPVDWENKALRAFEDFKHTNDERLAQIEARMSADIVTSDKLDRINRALDGYKQTVDELMLKAARPQRGGAAKAKSLTLPPSYDQDFQACRRFLDQHA